MATNIVLTDLTNGDIDPVSGEWVGTGIFDVLISAVNKNIQIQYDSSRITGTDYANVYLGSIQSVLAQSMDYLKQEKLIEAQVDLAQEQVQATYAERIIKDKEAAKLGLDTIVQTANVSPEAVYTPKYNKG